ncbi:HMR1 protein, partial [Atractosteus spatula]|nr:HMR1 protein [Atractosteus spatula]
MDQAGNFEFVTVGMVNDIILQYYDSNQKKLVPRTDWMKNAVSPHLWEGYTRRFVMKQEQIYTNLRAAIQRFNHTEGIHTYQRMARCEMDADGTRRGFSSEAYDGNDFISFDLKTQSWNAAVPQANIIKERNELNSGHRDYLMNYYQFECFDLLKTFLKYGKEALERKEAPQVSLHMKKGVSPSEAEVTCIVTGFYPQEITVNWVRDGNVTVEEKFLAGEVLPNGDGTYQVRSVLAVNLEDPESHTYSCQVTHLSMTETLVVKWGKKLISRIKTN